jgi:molecular chaperone DnaK
MAHAIGIDLGTTNSVVSVYRRGIAETLPVDGRSALPSVVSFRPDGSVLVGQAAKSRLLLDPENTVASAKRFMGDRGKRYPIGRRSLSPPDVAALVLGKLKASAEAALGEAIWDAVITVPAYFTEAQREDTKRAGEEAGFNVLRLIPEPTAAAIAYGLDKGKDQTLMVYDLGGGTFDVSILQVRGNKFEVKAVGGDGNLGGDDFDAAIASWAADRFHTETGVDILATKGSEGTLARQRLKEAAEAAKIELSQSDRAEISIPDFLGHPLDLELTLTEYNALIAPLLDRTVAAMKSVLQDARMRPEDIDRVILVGGSTKNRAVRALIAKEIKDPFTSDRVDEVVAHGGAIVAANMFLPEEDATPLEITDVTAHSLGVDVIDDAEKLSFHAIIPRQTAYPCRLGMLGSTHRPLQDKVILRVFRGEDENPDRNAYLGELDLPVIPPQKDFVPISAIFELDADGIIHFTAVQLPAIHRSEAIIRYSMEHDGAVDIAAVDALIRSGDARTKSVDIRTS